MDQDINTQDLDKLKRLDALINDVLDWFDENEEHPLAEDLFDPLSVASAAIHQVLTANSAHERQA